MKNKFLIITPLIIIIILLGIIAFQLIHNNASSSVGQSITNGNGNLPKNLPPGARVQDMGGGRYLIKK